MLIVYDQNGAAVVLHDILMVEGFPKIDDSGFKRLKQRPIFESDHLLVGNFWEMQSGQT